MRLTDEIAKDYPIPDKYLIEIGRVSALWASLESSLNMALGKLAGFNDLTHPAPFVLLTHASFPQRIDMLSSFCVLLSPAFPNLTKYQEVIAKLREAQKLRNRFAHNGLDYNSEDNSCRMVILSARGKIKAETVAVTIEDIRKASEYIHLAMLSLHELVTGKLYPPIWSRDNTQPNP